MELYNGKMILEMNRDYFYVYVQVWLKVIILIYYRPIQCMLLNLTSTAPIEDLAISNLLEIDQKQSDINDNWGGRRNEIDFDSKRKGSLYNRYLMNKPKAFFKEIHQSQQRQLVSSRILNSQMRNVYEENDNLIIGMINHLQSSHQASSGKSQKFNEGQYWSSKVNWTTNHIKQENRSQPKISKKFSFGYQTNLRGSLKGSSRYEGQQKFKNDQYKTNLIYSILNGQAQLIRLRHLQQRTDDVLSNRSSKLLKDNNLKKSYQGKCQGKSKEITNNKLNKIIQRSMRDTLNKLCIKNEKQGHSFSEGHFSKPSQIERGAMIRQLLHNMEDAKMPTKEEIHQNRIQKEKIRHVQMIGDAIQPILQRQQSKKKQGSILNLNLQAQKIYKNNPKTRWTGRRKPGQTIKGQ